MPTVPPQLAGMKVLVKSVCVWPPIIAIRGERVGIGATVGDAVFIQMWNYHEKSAVCNKRRRALTGYEQLAMAVVAAVVCVHRVAAFECWERSGPRYPSREHRWICCCCLYGLRWSCWALADGTRHRTRDLAGAISERSWIAASAIALATGISPLAGFAEQLLTLRQASGAVLVSAAFGAAWLTMLRAAGVSLAGMPAADAAWMLSPALMPLTLGLLAPWSYSRIRHL